MRRKSLPGTAVAAIAALTVASCSTASEDDENTGLDLADLSGEQLEVAGVWSGEEQEAFETVLKAFEEQTGAEITYTSAGDDLPTVLQTKLDGNAPPNVAVLPQPGLITEFAEAGGLEPLSSETEKLLNENYAEFWTELASVDGTTYGVYFKAANKSTFWYNDLLFQEVGVGPPENMDELIELAGILSDNGITPLSVGGADGWVLTDWFENIYLQTAGPENYEKLSNHEIPWTDPSVAEALEVMGSLFTEDFLDGGAGGALQTDFPTSVSNVFAEDSDVAMVYEADFVAGEITSSTNAVVGEDALFFPFPVIGDNDPSVIVGGDAAVAFTGDEATEQLMQFLATPEAAQIWAERGGFLSPNKNVELDAYPDQISRSVAEQLLDAGENVRFDMSDLAPAAFGATKGAGMWQDLQDFLRNVDDVEGVMAQLEADAADAFGT